MRFSPVLKLALFACVAASAHAGDHTAEIAALLPLLEKNTELRSAYEACPADIYRTKATLFSLLGTTDGPDLFTCAADLKFCHDSCVQGKNGDACFSLARVLQGLSEPAADRHYEPLFALACAIGKPSGCTNRGGGMRNGGYTEDPSGKWSEEARGLCLRRTFKAGCDGGDAWGCAMYGQSLFLGEGGAADWAAARRRLGNPARSIRISTAANFRKSYLSDMKALDAQQ